MNPEYAIFIDIDIEGAGLFAADILPAHAIISPFEVGNAGVRHFSIGGLGDLLPAKPIGAIGYFEFVPDGESDFEDAAFIIRSRVGIEGDGVRRAPVIGFP